MPQRERLQQAGRRHPLARPVRLPLLLVVLLLGCTRTDPSDARSRTLLEALRAPVALTEPTALPFPRSLAADADYLYWTNYDARTVNRIAKAGGAPELLAHTGVDPGSLHVDGQRLYVGHTVAERRAGESIGAVSTWTKPDWNGRELARADGRITDVAVGDTHVYFSTGTAVMRVPKEGGAPVTLATAQQVFSVVIDADAVFFADYGQGTINRVASSGGPVLALARDLSGPRSLASDETHLYWITYDRRLMRVAKSGGPVTTLLYEVGLYDTCDTGIAVAAAHLYVTSCCDPGSNSGQILDVQPADGTATVMAKDITKPCNPVADTNNVYWSTTTVSTQHALFPGGVIFKIAR